MINCFECSCITYKVNIDEYYSELLQYLEELSEGV